MVRSHTVLVLTHYPAKKSLLVVVVSGEWWQTKFSVSPGPGLWSLDLGPFGPDLGPGPELDNNVSENSNNKVLFMDSSYFRPEMNTTLPKYFTNTCLEAEYNYDTIR